MEKGSVIDAQITFIEEVNKEVERCRDWRYFYINYMRVIKVDETLEKPIIELKSPLKLVMYKDRNRHQLYRLDV